MVFPYARSSWAGTAHRHDDLEFNLVERGTLRYLLAEGAYEAPAGTLLWLFPGQPHLLAEPAGGFRAWVALFRPALVREACPDPAARVLRRRDPGRGFCRRLEPHAAAELGRLCARTAALAGDPGRETAALMFLLREAWAAFQAAAPAPDPVRAHPAVARAATLLAGGDRRDLNALSAACGLSRARLSRQFAAATGVTLQAWRTRQRVRRFLALREQEPDLSAVRAASLAGFGSYAQCARSLHAATGAPPTAPRSRRRGGTPTAPGPG